MFYPQQNIFFFLTHKSISQIVRLDISLIWINLSIEILWLVIDVMYISPFYYQGISSLKIHGKRNNIQRRETNKIAQIFLPCFSQR